MSIHQELESERATCNVELECMNFTFLGGPEHCGLKLVFSRDDTRCYHVLGPPTCDPCSGRPRVPIIGGDYLSRGSVIVDHTVCQCIEETADRIRRQKLPYSPIPGNDPCGGKPSCNSNYTTKCLLSFCGVGDKFGTEWWFDPVGWNHRMKTCIDVEQPSPSVATPNPAGKGCCCLEWRTDDDSWCSERTLDEVKEDPPGRMWL